MVGGPGGKGKLANMQIRGEICKWNRHGVYICQKPINRIPKKSRHKSAKISSECASDRLPREKERKKMGEGEEESSWRKETIPKIIKIICSRNNPSLSQRDLYSLLLVSPSCYRALLSLPNLWQVLTNLNPNLLQLPRWRNRCLIENFWWNLCRPFISEKWIEQERSWSLRFHWWVLMVIRFCDSFGWVFF